MRAAMRGRARCHSHANRPGAPTGRMNGRYAHGGRTKTTIARRAYTTKKLDTGAVETTTVSLKTGESVHSRNTTRLVLGDVLLKPAQYFGTCKVQ